MGSKLESDLLAKYEREIKTVARLFDGKLDKPVGIEEVQVIWTKIRTEEGKPPLAVLSGVNGAGAKVVAFVFGDDTWSLILRVARLVEQGQLKWKLDD